MTTRDSTTLRNTVVTTRSAEYNNGYLRIYDGTRPTDPNTAVGAQVLLAELRFNVTAFGAAAAGAATANAFTNDAAANATGTASWFRCLKADGTTVLTDGDIGTDITLNSNAIQVNAAVEITAMTLSQPA